MKGLSRRNWLTLAAAGGVATAAASARAASFGDPDEPPQGAINANPGSLRDPRTAELSARITIPQCS